MNTKTEEISETKQHILNMAEQLFALRGFDGVSMREIAEACDITKANIYYYFKDKESLYLEVLENDLLEIIAALRLAARAEGTCRVRIARIVASIARVPLTSPRSNGGNCPPCPKAWNKCLRLIFAT